MRIYYDIRLSDRNITKRELEGEAIVKAGRYFIAKTLLELGAATVDPLSPANPLIFSAGPFAGTSFSNANRTSVGCKSPLTGGIKEANGGGSFSYGLGQQKIAGFTLLDASPDWVVIHFKKDGTIEFDDARPYLGKGNFEAQNMLHAKYGKKVTIGLCGPVGEYQGLIAGIAFSDKDGRPARLSARGGVGAHYEVRRVPVIKKQAISAYDPRVVEATGVSMMATAQGADHTAGNIPRLKTREMDPQAVISQSLVAQTAAAATDSLGLCIFGRSVTEVQTEFLANAINAAHGTSLGKDFFEALGREALRLEAEFNRRAGFTEKDDELPAFFYEEPVPPTNHVARFRGADVHGMYDRLPT